MRLCARTFGSRKYVLYCGAGKRHGLRMRSRRWKNGHCAQTVRARECLPGSPVPNMPCIPALPVPSGAPTMTRHVKWPRRTPSLTRSLLQPRVMRMHCLRRMICKPPQWRSAEFRAGPIRMNEGSARGHCLFGIDQCRQDLVVDLQPAASLFGSAFAVRDDGGDLLADETHDIVES